MNTRRFISIGLCMVIFTLVFTGTSCKSRKAVCDANRQNKNLKMKKNKSGYGIKYGFKSKPVKKSYVIRNGR